MPRCRGDATQERTNLESFALLEPRADGLCPYLRDGEKLPAEQLLLDQADQPEVTYRFHDAFHLRTRPSLAGPLLLAR